jgi:hypothetical protein
MTSGRSRRLKLGNREIEPKHGARWQFVWPNALTGKHCALLSGLAPNVRRRHCKAARYRVGIHANDWRDSS